MFKSKHLLLLFSLFLATIVSSHSTENSDQSNNRSKYHYSYQGLIGNFDFVPLDDLYVEPQKPALKIFNHAFVPDSHGSPQGREAFKLLFSGQEDPATVRIRTRTTTDQYTLREKIHYMISGKQVPASSLTGTITSYGILTNSHGFVEEVPSITNIFLKYVIRTDKLYYRTLEPLKIEQGVTLREFQPENKDLFYDYISPALIPLHSHHAIYFQEEIESVYIDPRYTQSLQKARRWLYGKLDEDADLALLNVIEHHQFSHTCPIATRYPHTSEQVKVKMYQYPGGHPLQKMSEENANFVDHTHQCATLPGSSGSALRDAINGEIIGVHRSGIEGEHNYFIPFCIEDAKNIDFKLYSRNKNANKI